MKFSYQINIEPKELSVLNAVVESYIDLCKPISSNYLKKHYFKNYSSSHIRFLMNSLEKKNLLMHYHISGGRVPTDLGYRVYVDSFGDILNHNEIKKDEIEKKLDSSSENTEQLLEATAYMLSKMSNMYSVVMLHDNDSSILKNIEIVNINSDSRLMMILTLDNGLIRSIVLNIDLKIKTSFIDKIVLELKNKLIGLSLFQIQHSIIHRLNDTENYNHELIQVIINDSKKYFSIDKEKLIFTSSAGALLDYPEFQDIYQFQRILPALDKKYLINYFESAFSDSSLEMIIGSENKDSIFNNCAIISMNFECDSVLGRLAVIGPKRTNYINKQIILKKFTEVIQNAL